MKGSKLKKVPPPPPIERSASHGRLKRVNVESDDDSDYDSPQIVHVSNVATSMNEMKKRGNGNNYEQDHQETPRRLVRGSNSKDKASKKEEPKSVNKSNKKNKNKIGSLNELLPINDQDNMFADMTLVLTGMFEAYGDRDSIKSSLEKRGAKCTSSVSGLTDILICGEMLEDGRHFTEGNKYKTAKQKGTLVVSEEEFSEFLLKNTGKTLQSYVLSDTAGHAPPVAAKKFYLNKKASKAPKVKKMSEEIDVNDLIDAGDQSKRHEMEIDNEYISEDDKVSKAPHKNNTVLTERMMKRQWTEKYKPKKSSEILGNEQSIEKLRSWLSSWAIALKNPKMKSTGLKKAALLSGSPGIGKSTAAILLAKELGFEIIVQNASDTRNKAAIDKFMGKIVGNSVLNLLALGKPQNSGISSKCVVVMDEVDGMSGDRGGMAKLIEYIKDSSQPIICIANDRQSQKVRTLANYCLDLKFVAPRLPELLKVVEEILLSEMNLHLNEDQRNYVSNLIEQNQFDVRQIFTHLQFWSELLFRGNTPLVGKEGNFILNPADACVKLLNLGGMPRNTQLFNEARSMFYVDYSLMPMFVFDNYFSSYNTRTNILEKMDYALDSMSKGETFAKILRTQRNYAILPSCAFFGGILPALAISRNIKFVNFPMILAQSSSRKKKRREYREIRQCLSSISPGMNVRSIRQTSTILSQVIADLMTKSKFEELLKVYETYDLTPIFVKENLEHIVAGKDKASPISSVPTSSKTSFSKYYMNNTGFKKVSGKSKVVAESEEQSRRPDEEEEEEETDQLEDDMVIEYDDF